LLIFITPVPLTSTVRDAGGFIDMANKDNVDLRGAALHFHEHPRPGKLEIVATKPLANTRDLSLA